MSSSRSQTPTISQPLILWICAACASAIFPQPTSAALSMTRLLSTALEIATQSLYRGHRRLPAKPLLELRVRVAGFLPVGVPAPPVERGGQLSLRPMGVLFPQATQDVAEGVRDVERPEAPDVFLILTQKASARRQIPVHDLEDRPRPTRPQAGQHDRLGAVVYVRQGDWIRAAQVQEKPERRDTDAVRQRLVAGAVHGAGSDGHVWNAELLSVFRHDLVLLGLAVHVWLATFRGLRLKGAGLVQ